jgi:hypothetical protein
MRLVPHSRYGGAFAGFPKDGELGNRAAVGWQKGTQPMLFGTKSERVVPGRINFGREAQGDWQVNSKPPMRREG